jgi:undecaprenyl diphosphate synthase
MRIPRHLAIIMDGNGRWAEQRHLPRIAGHHRGVETVQTVVKECRAMGIACLTLYAFSSENWGRPEEEVNALMGLLAEYLRSELKTMMARGIRLKVIGETNRLPVEARKILEETVTRTRDNQDMVLTLALSYGARNELVRAARHLAGEALAGRLAPEDIDDRAMEKALDTADLPDPDLLIRTSGEMRISNFLLWQLAYTELFFTDVLWPDFNERELRRAIDEFGGRQRRFGLTGEQVRTDDCCPGEGHH